MRTLAAVLVASGLGGGARYGIGLLVGRRDDGFLIVNLSGAFLIGLLTGLLAERAGAPAWLQAALVIGFLGSFTTFSTLTLDSVRLAERGLDGPAIANVAGAIVAGLVATYAGPVLGRVV